MEEPKRVENLSYHRSASPRTTGESALTIEDMFPSLFFGLCCPSGPSEAISHGPLGKEHALQAFQFRR